MCSVSVHEDSISNVNMMIKMMKMSNDGMDDGDCDNGQYADSDADYKNYNILSTGLLNHLKY